MRFVRATLTAAAALAGLLAVGGATGQEALEPPGEVLEFEGVVPDISALSREERLDDLFTALAAAPDADAAEVAESQIVDLWMDSGSDTINLLMDWTLQAIDEEDFPLALDFLDRITSLQPGYVEGWNKRATVYFMTDDLGKSLADLERVLAMEPRHFAALSGLGTILRAIGDDKGAAEAYRRALDLDPFLEQVQEALDEIVAEGEGI